MEGSVVRGGLALGANSALKLVQRFTEPPRWDRIVK